MVKMNHHFDRLEESYLFSEVARRVAAFTKSHPEKNIIRLGIGDVTLPLCPAVVAAMQAAVEEMGEKAHFHGYGPEQGYPFLREAIAGHYRALGVELDAEEVFVSDGAKSDLGNILDLFAAENTVLIPDPVYPVYVDTNLMAGRKIYFCQANAENGFLPLPDPYQKADILYLCSPNNPTGAAYDRQGLTKWVEYARKIGAVILFDAAYEAFIEGEGYPHSIFEIPGARECAIEFCSLSKTAGFTGTRCGYTVIPKELCFEGYNVGKLWLRRQCTKFNGVPYIVQRGAAAVFSPQGMAQAKTALGYYKENARIMAEGLKEMGIWFTGGVHSPYLWLRCPYSMGSWQFFDALLSQCAVVGTPGVGFGKNGEGFFRLTAFGDREETREAMARMVKAFGKR